MGNVNGTSKAYGELIKRRGAWAKALEKQGVQFRFLASPQIESGELDKYRVLILPYSIALSDAEAKAIERFIERGGTVYADDQTGRMDERCHWRKPQLFAGERKGVVRKEPGPVAVTPGFQVEGDFLTTIRNFGGARLVGVLGREAKTVKLPATDKVRYDLLRGGLATETVESSAEKPVLLVERAAKIAKLEVAPDLGIRLAEEGGAPVDRSVVHVDVFDPAGKLVRPYSGNVTVRDGRAKFEVPFALSDAAGAWRVRARDVVSGLTAERIVKR